MPQKVASSSPEGGSYRRRLSAAVIGGVGEAGIFGVGRFDRVPCVGTRRSVEGHPQWLRVGARLSYLSSLPHPQGPLKRY